MLQHILPPAEVSSSFFFFFSSHQNLQPENYSLHTTKPDLTRLDLTYHVWRFTFAVWRLPLAPNPTSTVSRFNAFRLTSTCKMKRLRSYHWYPNSKLKLKLKLLSFFLHILHHPACTMNYVSLLNVVLSAKNTTLLLSYQVSAALASKPNLIKHVSSIFHIFHVFHMTPRDNNVL